MLGKVKTIIIIIIKNADNYSPGFILMNIIQLKLNTLFRYILDFLKVNMAKINIPAQTTWIEHNIAQYLGTEDDVLVSYVLNLLEQVCCFLLESQPPLFSSLCSFSPQLAYLIYIKSTFQDKQGHSSLVYTEAYISTHV